MAWAGLGGTLGVWALGWTWMDPVATLAIAYWVAPRSLGSVRRSAGNRGPGTSIERLWSQSIDYEEIVR
ncbi:MAG: hypothetical protein C7B46_14970 [Sulfobacillus benefaciens]|uniref:Uncharacterized protein n=1 Tax=Sulfobacillus benefaciens TaxID=453960 RepID=A0A2T2XCR4_9FIRM|nr:MAG: hypothetical protein C7B46_14970 [Sulfobacillus benefaciens]